VLRNEGSKLFLDVLSGKVLRPEGDPCWGEGEIRGCSSPCKECPGEADGVVLREKRDRPLPAERGPVVQGVSVERESVLTRGGKRKKNRPTSEKLVL